ncbi:MAG: type I restriction enzyme HsdR N-terminal domain-containing protein [Candidatus Micrarchaeota archaeon]
MIEKKYWAISASEGDERDFSEIFFDFGIACLGGKNQKEIAKKVNAGDLLVLKKSRGDGTFLIQAIGRIIKAFSLNSSFDDVEGWNLDFVAEVEWYASGTDAPVEGLKQGTIFSINKDSPKQIAENILAQGNRIIQKNKLSNLPNIKFLEQEKLLSFLIQNGLSSTYAENLSSAINRVKRLALYYNDILDKNDYRKEHLPTEDETRAFLVLPLLFSLGWSEQRIRLEIKTDKGGEVDIALYKKPHELGDSIAPYAIIEVKRLTKGLERAKKQVMNYFECYPSCKRCIVTNGFSYKVWERGKPDFTAYLNITKMLDGYRFKGGVGGAQEVFRALLPPEYSE